MKIFTTLNSKTLSNIYFITDDACNKGVLIDPGDFSLNVYRLIKYAGAPVSKIILTHNGIEQTAGIPLIKKIYDVEIFAHSEGSADFPITKVKDGSIIKEGDLEFKVMETPIHAYDSISILADNF
nr:MBL fold metallo-hydrolase [Spirochaetota bacterium]